MNSKKDAGRQVEGAEDRPTTRLQFAGRGAAHAQERKLRWFARLRILFVLLLLLGAALTTPLGVAAKPAKVGTGTYTNPLTVNSPVGMVDNCPDPTVIRGQQPGDNYWYMYCTKDPFNDEDHAAGRYGTFTGIPVFRSHDLVNWTFEGQALEEVPDWGAPTSGLWAPEISYFNDRYYLYYTMPDPKAEVSGAPNCGFEPAIGVATSESPLGPWKDLGRPVVEPRYNGPPRPFGERECNFFWTIDPEVLVEGDQRYLYYGSYYGGVQGRELSADGFVADPEKAVQVTGPNRYEAPEIVKRDGYYYLLVSATNCCAGPLTGYTVFAGRSTSPLGPFVDREGVPLLVDIDRGDDASAGSDGRIGGTPVLSMNGNRWVGPGHNTVFQDFEGQSWTIYHAIDRFDPYFDETNFTKRPVLLDALDWIDGWPTVRGGRWVSDTPQPAPAAQPGDKSKYKMRTPIEDRPDALVFAEEFDTTSAPEGWEWVRQPGAGTYGFEGGTFRFDTQAADLFVDTNNASVFTRPLPEDGDYLLETRVKLNVPPNGCCYNYTQAGLVVYGDDDNYLKLAHVSIWETRQTEFAKEVSPVPAGYPRFGTTVVTAPDEWTYLRIVKRAGDNDEDLYTAYTSRDGVNWNRGGTWTHTLGADARVGLVSMGGSGFVANFDYVRVHRLATP